MPDLTIHRDVPGDEWIAVEYGAASGALQWADQWVRVWGETDGGEDRIYYENHDGSIVMLARNEHDRQ